MVWTDPEDVVDSWIGPDAPDDLELLEVWVGKAEREIRFRVPDIQSRVDAEAAETPPRTDLLDTARDVVVAMVTRVFRNPEGTRQTNRTNTTGPFSETLSTTYGGDIPGGLSLTDSELAKLQGTRVGAFTIDLLPSQSSACRWL